MTQKRLGNEFVNCTQLYTLCARVRAGDCFTARIGGAHLPRPRCGQSCAGWDANGAAFATPRMAERRKGVRRQLWKASTGRSSHVEYI